jgi:putative glutamine amidotransferase
VSSPLIAVAGMRSASVRGLRRSGVVAAERVLDALRRAGGEPVVLPPAPGAWTPQRLSATFAGLVLPGGSDVDPVFYGGEPVEAVDRLHDEADMALVRAAIAAAVPVLAICRGMQVLNVALGGTLVADLPAGAVPHREGFHPVDLDAGCLVARAMGTTRPVVSSYHHQAVDRLGAGLVATGRAEDGVIEVVQHTSAPILAVQWHPEDDADVQPNEQALFDAVVDPSVLNVRWCARSQNERPRAVYRARTHATRASGRRGAEVEPGS